MTMPPSQHPPGPYGAPQPPQPYGGQYHAPQPSSHPHQQPYPGQGAWGQPPLGPPRRNRTGMVVGIVVGSLVVFGSVVSAVASGGRGFPEAKYRLTVPKTVVDGTYALAQDLSDTEGEQALKGSRDAGIRDPKPVVAQYSSDVPGPGSALVMAGMYGRFKDPEGARRKMLAGAEDAEGASVAVPARDVTPAGSDITVSCEVLTMKKGSVKSTLPMCAWADENTGASVAVFTPEIARQQPGAVDLARIAEITLKVRAESRLPLG
ncbi:hypothetical protein [Streptomyces sp. NPDC005533]|uniref:hypothetical protein n=1 Tax=Streptomyces sp. NPDC005533 TaxID=3364723 RepID=UPI0036880919